MDRRGWHALGRLSGVSTALAFIGSMLWGGCSSDTSTVCDATGCHTCDGFGCSGGSGGPGDGGGSGGPLDAGIAPDSSTPTDSGVWVPPPPACKYPSDCPDNKSCVNGQCVPSCSDSTQCTPGTVCSLKDGGAGVCQPPPPQCTNDSQCPPNAPKCAGGQCVAKCTNDSQCPKGDYCYNGACIPDTRPVQNCSATDTSACNKNQVCIDGYCKYTCNNDLTCRETDDRIPFCGVDKVCRTQAEAHPQCTSAADCKAGQSCVNNICE